MPCQFTGCGAAADARTNSWNVGQLCTAHYGTIGNLYPGLNAHLVDDFIKVHVLLQHNTAQCLADMGAFNGEMAVAAAGAAPTDPRFSNAQGRANYLKLSRALEYYEGLCWFPANRALLSGLLTPNGFNQSLKLGFNKDPGAGAYHGEQSHRLQWHTIMRRMTDHFQSSFHTGADWKHSPLQLFYHYTQGSGAGVGAWGKAMDSQGNQGWGNPDNVVIDILQSPHQLLKEALTRRIQKYGGVDPNNPVAVTPGAKPPRVLAVENAIITLAGRRQITIVGSVDGFRDKVLLQIYTWEKAGTPILPTTDTFKKGAKAVYEEAKTQAPAAFQVDKTYKTEDKNLLVKKDAPDRLVEIDNTLITKSRGGFNIDYAFGVSGARAVAPNRA